MSLREFKKFYGCWYQCDRCGDGSVTEVKRVGRDGYRGYTLDELTAAVSKSGWKLGTDEGDVCGECIRYEDRILTVMIGEVTP